MSVFFSSLNFLFNFIFSHPILLSNLLWWSKYEDLVISKKNYGGRLVINLVK